MESMSSVCVTGFENVIDTIMLMIIHLIYGKLIIT